jgi:three-Cys-motif partner protein
MRTGLRFGGSWTEDKLDRVKRYLDKYMVIFRKYPNLTPMYVDAFAGTGYREQTIEPGAAQLPFPDLDKEEQAFLKGSARIALEIDPPFGQYVFIEANPIHAAALIELKREFSHLKERMDIVPGDANAFLKKWCSTTKWHDHRAVVFLDPCGTQVEWSTVQRLAATESVDLWYLFPLSAVTRLMPRAGKPPAGWVDRINLIYGTDTWQEEFYPRKSDATLFGDIETGYRDADLKAITQFTLSRLRSEFPAVAPNPLILRNDRNNSPLFLLCFAVASKRRETQNAALRIASHILSM